MIVRCCYDHVNLIFALGGLFCVRHRVKYSNTLSPAVTACLTIVHWNKLSITILHNKVLAGVRYINGIVI